MKSFVILTLSSLLAVSLATKTSAATFSTSYDWEDGPGTILGSFGNVTAVANVTSGTELGDNVSLGPVSPYAGNHMLTASEDPHTGTPQTYLAYIEGLEPGDVVNASFWGWDSTSGASPSQRIWGHYALNGDVNSYAGSAGGNSAYTDGSGWSQVSFSWTIPSGQER